MKRTLNSTDTAKKIAADHGLTFTYNRSARVWILAARHHVAGMMDSRYTPGEIAGFDTDTFYWHCTEVATHTATPEQMHKVFQRAKHAELFDMLAREGREKFTDDERAQWLELNPTSHDKQVHAIEDAIYQMRLDAEEVGGSYADHKAKFAGVRAVESYGKGKHVGYTVDGRFVMSLPAQLNNGRIPCAEECDDILNGESVTESDGWRFRARDLHELARAIVADTVLCWPGDKVGAALTVTGDGTPQGVKYVMWNGKRSHTLHAIATSPLRLYTHWRGFLENCAAAEQATPQGERRTAGPSVFDQMQERRRASVPAAHDELPAPPAVVYVPLDVLHQPGDPCPTCNACMHEGQDMCDDCRQIAPSVVNLYQCPICEHEWRDAWIAVDSDDCPNCGAKNVEPYDSEHDEVTQ
jgi:hypothetical protein